MEKRVSVAEARRSLPKLIRLAEEGSAIEITRRGEPVAVILSIAEYRALTGERIDFMAAVDRVRERFNVAELGLGDEDFEGLRNDSPGRDVSF